MRIIFVTPNLDVDDLEVGYIHRWIEELAKHATHIEVICAREGYHTLPQHVHVRSLGVEKKVRVITRVVRACWHTFATLLRGDVVFVHGSIVPILLAGPLWRLMRKRVGVWYEAGAVTPLFAVARLCITDIFTPTTEAYQAGGDEKHVVGHGIDHEVFSPLARPRHDGTFRIVTGGHISRSKDYSTLIHAIAIFNETIDAPFRLTIVGAPKPGEETYAEEARTLVRSYGLGEHVVFTGPMKNKEVRNLYRESDLYVSVYTLDRVEKSLAEAAHIGLPIVTSNRGFEDFAGEYDSFVFFPKGDASLLAERLRRFKMMSYDARRTLGHAFHKIAVRDHSIDTLARGIIHGFQNPR